MFSEFSGCLYRVLERCSSNWLLWCQCWPLLGEHSLDKGSEVWSNGNGGGHDPENIECLVAQAKDVTARLSTCSRAVRAMLPIQPKA